MICRYLCTRLVGFLASVNVSATEVVTLYVFHEPSLLSSLQDRKLTDVILEALVVKEVGGT